LARRFQRYPRAGSLRFEEFVQARHEFVHACMGAAVGRRKIVHRHSVAVRSKLEKRRKKVINIE
jgi:hypothetical protein